MEKYWTAVGRELKGQRMLRPVFIAPQPYTKLAHSLAQMFPGARVVNTREGKLVGSDVVVIHAGDTGWEGLLADICRESPGRLFVVAPECPRTEALRLKWVADKVIVGRETYEHELPELMSA